VLGEKKAGTMSKAIRTRERGGNGISITKADKVAKGYERGGECGKINMPAYNDTK